jgi:hypothetical protein
MLKEIALRLVIGGLFVSAFAILADLIKPKRFAGLFAAAPSVALATLALAGRTQGKLYAAIEARSMVAGAIAFMAYSYFVCQVIFRYKPPAIRTTLLLIPLWLAVSFGIWFAWLR